MILSYSTACCQCSTFSQITLKLHFSMLWISPVLHGQWQNSILWLQVGSFLAKLTSTKTQIACDFVEIQNSITHGPTNFTSLLGSARKRNGLLAYFGVFPLSMPCNPFFFLPQLTVLALVPSEQPMLDTSLTRIYGHQTVFLCPLSWWRKHP